MLALLASLRSRQGSMESRPTQATRQSLYHLPSTILGSACYGV
jgi:hypothetical protein